MGTLRTRAVVLGLCAAVILSMTSVSPARAATYEYSSYGEGRMASYINAARSARGLRKLNVYTSIRDVSRRHSYEMARDNRIYHTSNLTYRLRYFEWRYAGENVGRGTYVWNVYKSFWNSSSHRANILSSRYSSMGVGVVIKGSYAYVTVTFLG